MNKTHYAGRQAASRYIAMLERNVCILRWVQAILAASRSVLTRFELEEFKFKFKTNL